MENHQNPNEVHLQLIQANISRLATVSFLIKGWSVTLVAAIFALSAKDTDIKFVFVAYFPTIMFWLLDGYFLGMERRFVAMYNSVVKGEVLKYQIAPNSFTSKRACMSSACLSRTLILFHGAIFFTILLVMFGFQLL